MSFVALSGVFPPKTINRFVISSNTPVCSRKGGRGSPIGEIVFIVLHFSLAVNVKMIDR
jgi:hypothetical protein